MIRTATAHVKSNPALWQGLQPKNQGELLPSSIRIKLELFFNASFSDVRIHIGPEASSIGAIAFACGSNIYFAPGHYNPYSRKGLQLLTHELTHVIQQRKGRVKNLMGAGIAIIHHELMEAEADMMGAAILMDDHKPMQSYTIENTLHRQTLKEPGLRIIAGLFTVDNQGTVIQCVLEAYKSGVQGSKGSKNIFKESTDNKTYFKSGTSTATQEVWKPVTLNAEFTRYTEVAGGADKIVAITPPAPTGWSETKVVNALRVGGVQAILNYPDFHGLHCHVTANRVNGVYPSFHVKFDFARDHISLFYKYSSGVFSNYGQNDSTRKNIIGAWRNDNRPDTFATWTATFKAEADRIARDLVSILNAP